MATTLTNANNGTAANGEAYFFNSKYPLADLVALADYVAAGNSLKAAMDKFGISYSPAWNFVAWRTAQCDGTAVDCSGLSPAQFSRKVAALRKAGHSWGQIMVLCNRTEGQVRRAYAERTNVRSEGTRVGKGGRYLADEPALYEGTNAEGDQYSTTGPRLAVGETVEQRLAK